MSLTDNILSVYRNATPDAISTGESWYWNAHSFAASLDNVSRSAGVIAALSPMSGWSHNKAKAEQFYAQKGDGTNIGLLRNVAKASRIYNGEDALDVLGGNKVRSFYMTIVDPNTDAVVIDRHAFDIATGQQNSDKVRSALFRKGEYERLAGIYRRAADNLGIGVSVLQAVTWVEWRDRIGKSWHG